MQPEGVVSPDNVAEQLVVLAVVGASMIRWSCQRLRECVPVPSARLEVPGDRLEPRTPLYHRPGRLDEVDALCRCEPRPRRDQLADEVRFELGAGGGRRTSSKRLTRPRFSASSKGELLPRRRR
jgi:hypothetical protein